MILGHLVFKLSAHASRADAALKAESGHPRDRFIDIWILCHNCPESMLNTRPITTCGFAFDKHQYCSRRSRCENLFIDQLMNDDPDDNIKLTVDGRLTVQSDTLQVALIIRASGFCGFSTRKKRVFARFSETPIHHSLSESGYSFRVTSWACLGQ